MSEVRVTLDGKDYVITPAPPLPALVPDPTPIPATATAVRIGTATYPVAGVDIERKVDALVVYTPAAGRVTATNVWGAEAPVIGSKVVGTSDRQAPPQQAAGTAIPSTGYVLSGHGKARDWLLANAKAGADAVLVVGPAPTPVPTPTPVPSGGRLPDGPIAAAWLFSWSGPGLGGIPADVAAILNHVTIAGLSSAQPGTGRLAYGGAGLTKTDVNAARARGCNTVAGIGGSSTNGQIMLKTSANAAEMAASLLDTQATYGIRGFDLDIENVSDWTEGVLSELVDRLRAADPGWIVGLTMGLYGDLQPKWLSAARLLGDRLDYAAPMLYDYPEAGDSRQTSVTLDKLRIMTDAGIPASKILLGFMCRVPGESYPNASPPEVADAAYRAGKAAHPGLRGAFVWETAREARSGWPFTRTTLKAARGL